VAYSTHLSSNTEGQLLNARTKYSNSSWGSISVILYLGEGVPVASFDSRIRQIVADGGVNAFLSPCRTQKFASLSKKQKLAYGKKRSGKIMEVRSLGNRLYRLNVNCFGGPVVGANNSHLLACVIERLLLIVELIGGFVQTKKNELASALDAA
jgi:hypothetical protein